MKTAILSSFLILASFGIQAQNYYVFESSCKKNDIEIITGDKIPDGYAVIGTGSILRMDDLKTIDDFNKKQLRQIKWHGNIAKACTVFVDFEGNQMDFYNKDKELIKYKHIQLYALKKAYPLKASK